MKVLVTGVAGFIGSHLGEKLLADGFEVVGLDNFDDFYSPRVKHDNIALCLKQDSFRFVEGDIRDGAGVEALLKNNGIDIIVHMAAKAGVRPSIEKPLEYQDVNVNGTMVLLEAARQHGIQKFIFCSSSSVYGNNEKVPFSETDNVDYPISPYAATKRAGELLCHTYSHLYEMDIICLRLFTVYGPRQRPDLAIHKFARLIEAGKEIPVYGDGSMARDFTYIDDIIQGIRAAMDHGKGYRIYNLGEAQPYRLDELISELEQALGKKARIERLGVPAGDVRQTFADIDRAKKELGYQPEMTLSGGLKVFVQWLRGQ